MTDDERIDQMKVLWKKARNMYTSFFTLLSEKRQEIGDAQLGDWCFHELHIDLEICLDISKCLRDTDAKLVRQDLAHAQQNERAKKIALDEKARALHLAEKADKEAKALRLRDLASMQLSRGQTKITDEMVEEAKARLLKNEPLMEKQLMKQFSTPDKVIGNTTIEGAIERARGMLIAEAGFYNITYEKKPKAKQAKSANKTDPVKKRTPQKSISGTDADKWMVTAVKAIRDRLPHFVGGKDQLKEVMLAEQVPAPKSESMWGRLIKAAEQHGVLQKVDVLGSRRGAAIYRVTPPAPPEQAKTEQPAVTSTAPAPETDTLAQTVLRILDELTRTWAEGTVMLCIKLKEARDKYGNDAFSIWLAETGIDKRLSKDERWALLHMAEHLDLTREKLAQTKSRSWQLLWRDEIAPCVRSATNTQDLNVIQFRLGNHG